ncbi:MAG: nucleotidyl transferase AbiEii/AbiGii toxin family protein [Gammaproteobacteria bacterium]|nr:nucleotidyl transferase AbiEii/AbiGii toxin family protein [Gammaproteobacteria bacterium]
MIAEEALKNLLNEDGRKAVLRRELLANSSSSSASCDRALKRCCNDGLLVRVGQGVYAVGDAKVFEIVPEIMPKLGYQIQSVQRVKGYSQKTSGRTWRLDRTCKRQIRKNGVYAMFEDNHGRPSNLRGLGRNSGHPIAREIEDRFHTFAQCHSLARAEKDLIVSRALDALEKFHDQRAILAIEGGTALAYYYRLINRFSEDLDVRIVLEPSVASLKREQRVSEIKNIGTAFRDHIQRSLPFLKFTNKGRVRRDGVVQSLIFDYSSLVPHDDIVAGLKVELVSVPLRTSLVPMVRKKDKEFPAVGFLEIAAGKWQALASRLPNHGDSNPDLVRHVHDVAALSAVIRASTKEFCETAYRESVNLETISAVLCELQKESWHDHYMDYMRRMGTTEVADEPGRHPTWEVTLSGFRNTADLLAEHGPRNANDAID